MKLIYYSKGRICWKCSYKKYQQDNETDSDINPNESIIEREIRLQREREAEVATMRKLALKHLQQPPLLQQEHVEISQSAHYQTQLEVDADINHNHSKDISHEDSVVSSSNEVENMIVRELRELKEREEEIRRLHGLLHRTHISDEIDGPGDASPSGQISNSSTNSQILSPSSQASWQRDVSSFLSPHRKESLDSTSSHSTGRSQSDIPSSRDVKVRPIADSYSDDEEQKPDYFQKQENPIEKEMRLARERENELRKQKGLPELNNTNDNSYSSFGAEQDPLDSSYVTRSRSVIQPGDSMKKFASNRLQQELQEQKNRELALLSEGKIITTSEQHIQPLKFIEVAGLEKNDGTLKRNYVTRKTTVSNNESGQQEVTSPSVQPARKTLTVGAGAQLFSYRESKQSAESKIERELREMKEREEELRKQRTGTQADISH